VRPRFPRSRPACPQPPAPAEAPRIGQERWLGDGVRGCRGWTGTSAASITNFQAVSGLIKFSLSPALQGLNSLRNLFWLGLNNAALGSTKGIWRGRGDAEVGSLPRRWVWRCSLPRPEKGLRHGRWAPAELARAGLNRRSARANLSDGE